MFYYVIEMLQLHYYAVLKSGTTMDFDAGNVIYLDFSILVALILGLINGGFSYYASFFFLKWIYAGCKQD